MAASAFLVACYSAGRKYRAAGFPLLPVVKGIKRTKLQMVPYIVLLIPTWILMFAYDYIGLFSWFFHCLAALFGCAYV